MVSLICCYNDPALYQDLEKGAGRQSVACELIGIDNRHGRYPSAAAALNAGAGQARGDVLVFVHQDIVFSSEDSLKQIAQSAANNKDTIVGLAGAFRGKRREVGPNLFFAETLDECCVAMQRSIWEQLRFDEAICDGWHLYMAEFCLRAAQAGVSSAYGNFDIIHLSTGNVDEQYMKTFKKLLVKYRDRKWITTTCKTMPANLFVFYMYLAVWRIKKRLLGNYSLAHRVKKLCGRTG